jgi:outer membrane biosynthesis protein TonB
MLRPMLPWDDLPEDASRKRRIDIIALVIAIILCLVVAVVKLPKLKREDTVVPERIARVVERKVELPPPPPPPKKEEKKAEEKPADKPKPAEVEEKVAKVKPTDKEVKDAREKASKALQASGVSDALADLRDMQTVAEINPGGTLQKDSGQPVGTSRNMINSRAGSGSGGLAYQGAHSSGFGGGVAGGSGGKGNYGLGSKGTTDMKGGAITSAGAIGGRGEGGGGRGEGGIGKRTPEEIRYIFNKYSAKIDSAYARALKDDPSLEGSISLRLVIDPNGSVTSCEVASSELNNPELEAKIVAIVKSFNFGDDNVEVWKGKFPVNLYPK